MKQAYIKMRVACSKFRAALDRLRPGKTNQDLNLVRTIPINQLCSLTAVPSHGPSPSQISSVVIDQRALRQDFNSLIHLLTPDQAPCQQQEQEGTESDEDSSNSTSYLIHSILHHRDFIRDVSQLRR